MTLEHINVHLHWWIRLLICIWKKQNELLWNTQNPNPSSQFCWITFTLLLTGKLPDVSPFGSFYSCLCLLFFLRHFSSSSLNLLNSCLYLSLITYETSDLWSLLNSPVHQQQYEEALEMGSDGCSSQPWLNPVHFPICLFTVRALTVST